MKTKVVPVMVTLCLLVGLCGCAPVSVTGLALPTAALTLAVGQTAELSLAPSYSAEAPSEDEMAAALAEAALLWSSSDEAVATVANGVVTAVAPGSAEIAVADGAGAHRAAVNVAVVVPVERAELPEELTLDLLSGETATLAVDVRPANATNVEVAYASSDDTVVTVGEDGTLTPVAEGEAEVTATVAGDGTDGRTTQALKTTVLVKKLPQGITLGESEGLLYVGYTHQLQPHTLPVEAPPSTYSFESGDEAVATAGADGTVTAQKVGTATITVTSAEGHTAMFTVTVTAAPAPARSTGGTGRGSGTGTGAGGNAGTSGGSTPSGGTGDTGGSTGGGDAGGGTNSGRDHSLISPDPSGDGSPGNPINGGEIDVYPDGQAINGWE